MTAVVLRGDARHLPLPDGSVDLIVTSPPYFGLRSYTDGGEHYAGQIGGEATPAQWLAALWDCTAEWVRVLKPEGSLFVNLGDRYASKPGAGPNSTAAMHQNRNVTPLYREGTPKSLLGLPWRYAIGATDQLGLILRAEIIWSKPNGLPESVTDRVRRAHEQVFHFTRQPRYYAAVDEIREPHTATVTGRNTNGWQHGPSGNREIGRGQWSDATVRDFATSPLGKLPGSVWPIPSAPLTVPAHLGVDHFAAFPPALVRPLVLGWSPPGVCTACGQGRRPVVDKRYLSAPNGYDSRGRWGLKGQPQDTPLPTRLGDGMSATITGYACDCTVANPSMAAGRVKLPPTRPAVVLDPFAGTGTTMLVASTHGRIGIGVDRSADYCRLAQWRCHDPGERARARDMPKPPPPPEGMEPLFDMAVTP